MGENILSQLLHTLPELRAFHAPGNAVYRMLADVAAREVAHTFGENGAGRAAFGMFGDIAFPYVSMGAIQSTHLFGLDELIIFSYYWKNRARYKSAADLGANLGLHTLMLARAGFAVTAYEPDPTHYALLSANIGRNGVEGRCNLVNKAISAQAGELEFVRVLGNTTGSHLRGAKQNPYGELETFVVQVDAFAPLLRQVDFLKIDVEGHEAVLLLSTTHDDWRKAEAMVEIGTPENAAAVFAHLQDAKVNMFAQKTGWQQVRRPEDMPVSYKEGSLFITCAEEMRW